MQIIPRIFDRSRTMKIMRRFRNARCHAKIAEDELTLFSKDYMLKAKQPQE